MTQLSIGQQFAALSLARWQAFRNATSKGMNKISAVLRFIVYALAGLLILAIACGFFAATYFALKNNKDFILRIELGLIFLWWQVIPLSMEARSPMLNFREIARYPVRFALYYMLSVFYGLLDPAALASVAFLTAMSIAMWMMGTLRAVRWSLAALLFIALNLLLNRMLFNALERTSQTRRGRDLITFISMGLLFAMQGVNFYFQTHMSRISESAKQRWLDLLNLLPPGMAYNLTVRDARSAALGGGALALAVCICALWVRRQLWRTYSGEVLSDSGRKKGANVRSIGWSLPFASQEFSAIVEKEFRTFMHSPKAMFNLAAGLLFIGIGVSRIQIMPTSAHGPSKLSAFTLPIITGYVLFSITSLGYNFFWSDSPGFQRWLLVATPISRIIRAKNAAIAMLTVAIILAASGLSAALNRVGGFLLLADWLGVVYFLLIFLAVGNLLSVYFPKKVDLTSIAKKNAQEISGFIAILVQVALFVIWFAAFAWTHSELTALATYTALIGLGTIIYLWSVQYSERYFHSHLDKFLDEFADKDR
jgi:hypothetical protein